MADKPVPLSKKYEVHGVVFDSLTVREPTGVEYWALGPIAEWQSAESGVAYVSYHEVVRSYAERLVQVPTGATAAAVLGVLNLSDTMKIDRAVKGFFTEAAKSKEPLTS